ncbi:hypothetical protein QO009_003027 [Brevibacillus aydinogluensis]|jgi:hypothetical protein|uniref:hypothetical protein n=1 Tax=Brevibacillus aydinogluensis TaxID=927786 RepID=UPI0028929E9F|nr:hypothetical protein [Brevibacillus aydinogluensis]MDT3417132.1 hypothetical protein [Brevibacillus aydinogluensis]
MRDNKAALKVILQGASELAATVGSVHVYRPRTVRERLEHEKSMLEEQDRQRFARLAELRSQLIVRS